MKHFSLFLKWLRNVPLARQSTTGDQDTQLHSRIPDIVLISVHMSPVLDFQGLFPLSADVPPVHEEGGETSDGITNQR